MVDISVRKSTFIASLALAALVAGCATPPPAPKPTAGQCQAMRSGDALAGNWLAIQKQKGIAGELHILLTLMPDGTMAYAEQLKRGKKPPQGLHETGCWHHEGQTLVLKTTKSNGVPVELADPIYTNQYQILAQSGKSLSLQGPDAAITARRMPAGYRLPY